MTTTLTATQHEALRRLDVWATDRWRMQAMEPQLLCEFDDESDVVSITDLDGTVTRYEYNERRCLARTVSAQGSITTYEYDDELDRLSSIDRDGVREEYKYDEHKRLTQVSRGDAGTSIFRWAALQDRVVAARTATTEEQYVYDQHGRLCEIQQVRNGVVLTLGLSFDDKGRLAELSYPGSKAKVSFAYDERNRPKRVRIGELGFVQYAYDDECFRVRTQHSNGVIEETLADAVDRRPLSQTISRGATSLRWAHAYDEGGRLISDGKRAYEYDPVGRLVKVTGEEGSWSYSYDEADGRLELSSELTFDSRGRLFHKDDRVYRYNDADQLVQVVEQGVVIATCEYDHKGRLSTSATEMRVERFVYGPADELFAITDEHGHPLWLYVRTPYGPTAVVTGSLDDGELTLLHCDQRGGVRAVSTNTHFEELRREAFGLPLDDRPHHLFASRRWFAKLGLYYFGARWYDPSLGRFLTPDSYTCGPDDLRLLNPFTTASQQSLMRRQCLAEWLKQPRTRNLFSFCANDPINRTDPNGHWSFGGVLLSILGAIWTLPNTIFGLFLEVTCLVGEVIRWLVWLVSLGHVSWATPGFDVAASGRLNAFALVFRGGWLGSFSRLVGVTFGNVIFVYDEWESNPKFNPPEEMVPIPAYNPPVSIRKRDTFYEHELRHTNQYGWLGPFFHLGMPLWGFYEWDVIFNGYKNSILERDATEHGGVGA